MFALFAGFRLVAHSSRSLRHVPSSPRCGVRLAKEDARVLRTGGKAKAAAANDLLALARWSALGPVLHRTLARLSLRCLPV